MAHCQDVVQRPRQLRWWPGTILADTELSTQPYVMLHYSPHRYTAAEHREDVLSTLSADPSASITFACDTYNHQLSSMANRTHKTTDINMCTNMQSLYPNALKTTTSLWKQPIFRVLPSKNYWGDKVKIWQNWLSQGRWLMWLVLVIVTLVTTARTASGR